MTRPPGSDSACADTERPRRLVAVGRRRSFGQGNDQGQFQSVLLAVPATGMGEWLPAVRVSASRGHGSKAGPLMAVLGLPGGQDWRCRPSGQRGPGPSHAKADAERIRPRSSWRRATSVLKIPHQEGRHLPGQLGHTRSNNEPDRQEAVSGVLHRDQVQTPMSRALLHQPIALGLEDRFSFSGVDMTMRGSLADGESRSGELRTARQRLMRLWSDGRSIFGCPRPRPKESFARKAERQLRTRCR